MRVIVHAGMQKTGSSSIQRYLDRNRETLKTQGIIYPDFAHHNHWALGMALAPADADGYLQRRGRNSKEADVARRAVAALQDIIAKGAPDSWLLLSHESFGGSPQAENLRALLTSDAGPLPTHVIAYIRSPLTHYPSAVQQALKSRQLELLCAGVWKSIHIRRARLLRTAFGEGVTLRVHGKGTLVGDDVVEDFRLWVAGISGRDLPPPHEDRNANSSFSAPACALLCRFLLDNIETSRAEFVTFRKLLAEFDATRQAAKLQVPSDWIALLAATNAVGWNALLEKAEIGLTDRTRLMLPVIDDAPAKSVAEVQNWVLSYMARDYAQQFAQHCLTGGFAGKGADRLSDWAVSIS